MIIFYNKENGEISGTIDGRVHTQEHLNMWVGNKEETERIICNWEKVGEEYLPTIEPKEIYIKLDNNSIKIRDLKVDLEKKILKYK